MSAEVAACRAAQKERAATDTRAGAAARSSAAVLTYVPEGQGVVPWHQISDFRITDSLVVRVNYSNGNLMLAATDFDVAGVGQPLRLARTFNSLDAPWGKVSQRWWQEYERYAQIFTSEVVICGREPAGQGRKAGLPTVGEGQHVMGHGPVGAAAVGGPDLVPGHRVLFAVSRHKGRPARPARFISLKIPRARLLFCVWCCGSMLDYVPCLTASRHLSSLDRTTP